MDDRCVGVTVCKFQCLKALAVRRFSVWGACFLQWVLACFSVQVECTHQRNLRCLHVSLCRLSTHIDEVGCLHVCKYVQPECTHWRMLGVGMFASVCNLSVPTGGCCVFVSVCAS